MAATVGLGDAVAWYCQCWLKANNRSPKTITAYAFDLRQFTLAVDPDVPLSDVSREHIERWLLLLQGRAYQPASIHRKIASLRGFLRHAEDRGVISSSPLHRMRLSLGRARQLTRVVSEADLHRLLTWLDGRVGASASSSAARTRFLALRDQAVIRLLCETGIRVGELATLTLDRISLDEGAIRVFGKGRRERLAYLVMDEERRLLGQYLESRARISIGGGLFVDYHGRSLTTEGIRLLLRRAGFSAGLKVRVTPHMLRHTAATRMLEHGADLRSIQVFLGHATIRSTERYTHVSAAHLKSVLRKCHPLLGHELVQAVA